MIRQIKIDKLDRPSYDDPWQEQRCDSQQKHQVRQTQVENQTVHPLLVHPGLHQHHYTGQVEEHSRDGDACMLQDPDAEVTGTDGGQKMGAGEQREGVVRVASHGGEVVGVSEGSVIHYCHVY